METQTIDGFPNETIAQSDPQLEDGLGTVGFNADERMSAFGTIRRDDGNVVLRGSYNATGATLEGEGIKLALAKAVTSQRGPRMRGSLIFTDTGEVTNVCLWAPKKQGAVAYGLSEDQPFEPGDMCMPF